jgi:carbon-monoxide dehydrogenase large subunit
VIDVAAHELGSIPIELRRRNLIPTSAMPFKTGLVFTYDCGNFARGMDLALSVAEHAGFEKRRAEARTRGKLRGIGIANAIEVAGGPYTSVNPDTAQICVNPDGSVTVNRATTSMGQGNETGFRADRVRHARCGARARAGAVGRQRRAGRRRGNGGSGALTVGGSAMVRASEKIVERGRRIAAA